MAKPTYSINNLTRDQLIQIEDMLNGNQPSAAAAPVPAAPVVAALAASPPPPAPVVAPAPPPLPAPVVAAPIAPAPVAAGGISQEDIIKKMGEIVAQPGKAASVGALMAQYNAKAPGTPGPIGNVDPVQYQNLFNALSAL